MSVIKVNWGPTTPRSPANLNQMETNLAEHTHVGGDNGRIIPPGGLARNMANLILSDDFTSLSASYVLRTGATLTINNVREGGNVVLNVSSWWTLTNCEAYFRVNRDSGVEYRTIGYQHTDDTLGAISKGFIGCKLYFANLAAGIHTFNLECKLEVLYGGFSMQNFGSVVPLELIAEEV
jgi:hypothetical protein